VNLGDASVHERRLASSGSALLAARLLLTSDGGVAIQNDSVATTQRECDPRARREAKKRGEAMRADPRVMVVDDDTDASEMVSAALVSEGYLVQIANNGKEALAQIHEGPLPMAVLLDLNMPVMNGREFLAAIRDDAVLAQIPVVVISADVRATPKGAIRAFRKPLVLQKLLDLLDTMRAAVEPA
jgi:CheY-like chemotaxis protein